MESAHTDETREKIVIPLFDIVVYPNSRTKFQVERATGELLLAGIDNPDSAFAIGLSVKSGTRTAEVTVESLYKTGNLFRISHVQPADDGFLICAEVLQRVRAVSLSEKNGLFYALYEAVPDLQDLEDSSPSQSTG
jgi:ATP-dependent Lon protease